MDSDKKFLVEKLAEYAERNRLTLGEIERLLRLCLQLERNCPGVQFVIPEGNAYSVELELQRQAQISQRPDISQEKFSKSHDKAWA